MKKYIYLIINFKNLFFIVSFFSLFIISICLIILQTFCAPHHKYCSDCDKQKKNDVNSMTKIFAYDEDFLIRYCKFLSIMYYLIRMQRTIAIKSIIV